MSNSFRLDIARMFSNTLMKQEQMNQMKYMAYDEQQKILHEWLSNSRHEIDYLPEYVVVDEYGCANVRVRVHVMSIQNIDTVKQSFDAKLWVQFKWSVNKPYQDVDCKDIENEWHPNFEVLNNIGKVSIDKKLSKSPRHRGDITDMYCRYVVLGTFAEQFELEQFPIDTQKLHIRFVCWGCPISAKRPFARLGDKPLEIDFPKRLSLYQLPGKNIIYKESFVQQDTWMLDNQVILRHSRTLPERNDDGVRFMSFDLFVTIHRSVGFFIWNVLVPVYLLVSLAFFSVFIHMEELSSRLQITLTLLLTLVALKYVIAQYLPTTSYLTYLDVYMLLSFVWVSVISGQNVLIYFHYEKLDKNDDHSLSRLRDIDKYTAAGLFSLWSVMHILVLCTFTGKIRNWLSISKEKRIEDDELECSLPIERTSDDRHANVIDCDAQSICY